MENAYMAYSLAVCLALTLIFEIFAAFVLGVRKKDDFFCIFFANVFTNPLVSVIPLYLNIRYGLIYRNISLALLEIFALFAEYLIYRRFLEYKKIPPFFLSLILNAFSYTAGFLLGPYIF